MKAAPKHGANIHCIYQLDKRTSYTALGKHLHEREKMTICLTKVKCPFILNSMGRLQEITRKILRKSNVSRYRISKDTGISEAALSLFVNGKRNIGLDHAETILSYLGYTIEVKQESEAE
jgi:hypothetical protein